MGRGGQTARRLDGSNGAQKSQRQVETGALSVELRLGPPLLRGRRRRSGGKDRRSRRHLSDALFRHALRCRGRRGLTQGDRLARCMPACDRCRITLGHCHRSRRRHGWLGALARLGHRRAFDRLGDRGAAAPRLRRRGVARQVRDAAIQHDAVPVVRLVVVGSELEDRSLGEIIHREARQVRRGADADGRDGHHDRHHAARRGGSALRRRERRSGEERGDERTGAHQRRAPPRPLHDQKRAKRRSPKGRRSDRVGTSTPPRGGASQPGARAGPRYGRGRQEGVRGNGRNASHGGQRGGNRCRAPPNQLTTAGAHPRSLHEHPIVVGRSLQVPLGAERRGRPGEPGGASSRTRQPVIGGARRRLPEIEGDRRRSSPCRATHCHGR